MQKGSQTWQNNKLRQQPANKIQASPAHTLFAHQLRTHRSNTHSFLQELLVFIFGLESQTFSIQDTSPLNQSEQGDLSGLGITR